MLWAATLGAQANLEETVFEISDQRQRVLGVPLFVILPRVGAFSTLITNQASRETIGLFGTAPTNNM